MDLIRNVLIDKAFFEAIDEVEQFLQDRDVDFGSIIQSLVFDKATFPTEEDARLWAREHFFDVDSVEEIDGSFKIQQLDPAQFIIDTFKEIPISNGVSAIVGILKIDALEGGPLSGFFCENGKDKDKFRTTIKLEPVNYKLNDNIPYIIELATVVSGHHATFGPVEITEEILQSFADNFNNDVVGVEIMIDCDHDQAEAAGWIKSVFLSLDKQTLLGEVRWTPKGAQKLNDRIFRYFSPEFTLNYVHPHTGVAHGPTLLGGGLVNRPFLKMDSIVSFKITNKNSEVIKMETISLKDHDAKVSTLTTEIADFKLNAEKVKNVITGQKADIESKDGEIKTLSDKVAELEKKEKDAKLEAKHDKLFSDKKICKAQLDALKAGKDPYEVLSLAENMNVNPRGKDGGSNPIVLSEEERSAAKAFGLTDEDMEKYGNKS